MESRRSMVEDVIEQRHKGSGCITSETHNLLLYYTVHSTVRECHENLTFGVEIRDFWPY